MNSPSNNRCGGVPEGKERRVEFVVRFIQNYRIQSIKHYKLPLDDSGHLRGTAAG